MPTIWNREASREAERRRLLALLAERQRRRDAISWLGKITNFGAASCADFIMESRRVVFNANATSHLPSSEADARRFQEVLREKGYPVTLRKNLGRDIQGACGQLVRKSERGRGGGAAS